MHGAPPEFPFGRETVIGRNLTRSRVWFGRAGPPPNPTLEGANRILLQYGVQSVKDHRVFIASSESGLRFEKVCPAGLLIATRHCDVLAGMSSAPAFKQNRFVKSWPLGKN